MIQFACVLRKQHSFAAATLLTGIIFGESAVCSHSSTSPTSLQHLSNISLRIGQAKVEVPIANSQVIVGGFMSLPPAKKDIAIIPPNTEYQDLRRCWNLKEDAT